MNTILSRSFDENSDPSGGIYRCDETDADGRTTLAPILYKRIPMKRPPAIMTMKRPPAIMMTLMIMLDVGPSLPGIVVLILKI